jgi:hypothetical protein
MSRACQTSISTVNSAATIAAAAAAAASCRVCKVRGISALFKKSLPAAIDAAAAVSYCNL